MVLSRFRRTSTRMWLIAYLMLRALVITTLGLLLLIRPYETVHRLAAFVGWVLIVLAVIDVLAAAYAPDRVTRRLLWVRAAFTAFVGLLLALLTTVSVTAVAVLIAMYLVVTGGVNMILGFHLRTEVRAWVGVAARGGLALAAGISALVWPGLTIVVVAMILGVHWVIGGLVSVSTAVGIWLESRGSRGKSKPGSAPSGATAGTLSSTPEPQLRRRPLMPSQPEPSAPTEATRTALSERDPHESSQDGGVEPFDDEREDVSLEDR